MFHHETYEEVVEELSKLDSKVLARALYGLSVFESMPSEMQHTVKILHSLELADEQLFKDRLIEHSPKEAATLIQAALYALPIMNKVKLLEEQAHSKKFGTDRPPTMLERMKEDLKKKFGDNVDFRFLDGLEESE